MKVVPAVRSLRGSIEMPPDKSIAHRSALFAALAEGRSVIENYSQAADPQTTLSCLRQLGVQIEQTGTTVTVYGVGRDGLSKPDTDVDCGNSGTTARLLTGILAGAGIPATLIGDESLSSRPMKRIMEPLATMGATFEARDGNFMPFSIRDPRAGNSEVLREHGLQDSDARTDVAGAEGADAAGYVTGTITEHEQDYTGKANVVDPRAAKNETSITTANRTVTPGLLNAITYTLPIPSAQVKSCLLLAGLFTNEPVTVVEPVITRDHTERLLNLDVVTRNGVRSTSTSRKTPVPLQNYTVPGDFSAATFWLVAASVYPDSEITLCNVGMNPTRTAALTILRRMGADVTVHNERYSVKEPVANLIVRSARLKAVSIHPDEIPNCIDELPVLSVAMAFADGVSSFRGAEDLRHKESDRLNAVSALLNGAGVKFDEHPDGLTIYGNPDFVGQPAVFNSLHDHRIAMSAAVLAGRASGPSTVKDAHCTAISYPNFWDDLTHLAIL
jgi:5-enolpyruvylshikimate-3-phosphate synthase